MHLAAVQATWANSGAVNKAWIINLDDLVTEDVGTGFHHEHLRQPKATFDNGGEPDRRTAMGVNVIDFGGAT